MDDPTHTSIVIDWDDFRDTLEELGVELSREEQVALWTHVARKFDLSDTLLSFREFIDYSIHTGEKG